MGGGTTLGKEKLTETSYRITAGAGDLGKGTPEKAERGVKRFFLKKGGKPKELG